MGFRIGAVCLGCACALLATTGGAVGEDGATPPPPGTMRFSSQADVFPDQPPAAFGPQDHLYAFVGLGRPWQELMKSAEKGTSAAVRVFVGKEQKGSAAFYPGVESFAKDRFVLELLPDPARSTQFLFGVPRALAALPPGRHQVRVQLWSFVATTPAGVLGEGTFTFVATEEGQAGLQALVKQLKEAKAKAEAQRRQQERKPPTPLQQRVVVRRGGSELLHLRGDEIVLDGAVVGKFEGTKVRKDGSIVGEIRGRTYRHEGSDVWSLDKGNLYAGTEIRWDGAIIGDIRGDGRIWWEGSDWGAVVPYGGTDAETMRIFAALYYFSDFFRRR